MTGHPEEAIEAGHFEARHSTASAAFARPRRGVVRRLPRPEGNCLMSSQIHPDQSADGSAEGAKHPGPSRRSVLYGAAGLAGAGLAATAVGSLAAPAAAATSAASRARTGAAAGVNGLAEPVIVHVRDLRSGEMDVFAGESKTRLRDPGLAAKLAHAIR